MIKVKYTALDYRGPPEVDVAEIKNGDSLLDHVERSGMKLPYGCRAGSCGVCRVEVLAGAEHFAALGFVEEDTLRRCGDGPGVRLACQAKLLATAAGALQLTKAKAVE